MAGFGRDIFQAIYEASPTTRSVVSKAAGCRLSSPGLVLDASTNSPGIGLPFAVTLTGVQGSPFLLIGTEQLPLALCTTAAGTCRLMVTPVVTLASGTFATTIPNDLALYGGTLAFQGLDVGSLSACSAAVFGVPFATSNLLVVTLQ